MRKMLSSLLDGESIFHAFCGASSKNADPILAAISNVSVPAACQFGRPEFHSFGRAIVYHNWNGNGRSHYLNRFTALTGDPVTPKGILKTTDAHCGRRFVENKSRLT